MILQYELEVVERWLVHTQRELHIHRAVRYNRSQYRLRLFGTISQVPIEYISFFSMHFMRKNCERIVCNVLNTKKLSSAILLLAYLMPLKYDIIWTENSDVIDDFIREILTFKELGDRVHSYFQNSRKVRMDPLSQLF